MGLDMVVGEVVGLRGCGDAGIEDGDGNREEDSGEHGGYRGVETGSPDVGKEGLEHQLEDGGGTCGVQRDGRGGGAQAAPNSIKRRIAGNGRNERKRPRTDTAAC